VKKVLVTGCAGFIGSNLVDRLLENGNKVVGIDNLSTGYLEFLDSALSNQDFTFHEVDLQETNSLASYFNEIDTFYHVFIHLNISIINITILVSNKTRSCRYYT
jgi:UDP-glucose 4-epimerase